MGTSRVQWKSKCCRRVLRRAGITNTITVPLSCSGSAGITNAILDLALSWRGGVTESGDTYQELMPVNVICHVLSQISRPMREEGSSRHRVGKLGMGGIGIVKVARKFNSSQRRRSRPYW